MSQHLPVFIVVLPLLAALGAPFLGKGRGPWILALTVSWITFGGSVEVLRRVVARGGEPILYELGGWIAPWGIQYRIDALNALFLVLVSGVAAVVTIQGRLTAAREVTRDQWSFFHSVYLLCLTGLLGMTITGDAFNVYVLLEVTSLSTYALVALGSHRRALSAGFNYLILGSIGATFILLGIGYLYVATGTLDMVDMAVRIEPLRDSRVVRAAVAFVFVGVGLKCALFPLHGWMPDAYGEAPSSVAALLSGTATKVGLYLLARFSFDIFGAEYCLELLNGRRVLAVLASAAILYGSTLALRQTDARRLLAWSSIAHVGYIVLGLALANADSVRGSLAHVVNHAVVKSGMFLALGAVGWRVGTVRLKDLRGLARRMPFTTAALTIGCLGLIGMPFTLGFVSKWNLVLGSLQAGAWPLVLILALGSALAAAYSWRLLSPMFLAPDGEVKREEAPFTLVAPAWILVGCSIALGVHARPLVDLAAMAARSLGPPELVR